MNLADFAAVTTRSSFDELGSGTGYTVGQWIRDGIFANLAAVKAAYSIVQDAEDHVDWVLLQSAVDFLIYGSLGDGNRHASKRTLFVPAGTFLLNRELNVGHARLGTPPRALNGNGYASLTIEGEGPQYDPAGNGMTGTTLAFEGTSRVGIALTTTVQFILRGVTVKGGYSFVQAGAPRTRPTGWDLATWKDPALPAANWVGGAAVNVGIAIDPYSTGASAAAYPARLLPAAFGGGTTRSDSGPAAGSDYLLEDVNIQNFVVAFGRPHGDGNGEFIRMHRGMVQNCVLGCVVGHSQHRNLSLDSVHFANLHTGITTVGGVTAVGNLHGRWDNLHFDRVVQPVLHPRAGWSGPVSLRNAYAESTTRIGDFSGLGGASLIEINNGFFSLEEANGEAAVPMNHMAGSSTKVLLRNTQINCRGFLVLDIGADAAHLTLDNVFISNLSKRALLTGAAAVHASLYTNNVLGCMEAERRSVHGVTVGYGNEGATFYQTAQSHGGTHLVHIGMQTVTYDVASSGFQERALGTVAQFPCPRLYRGFALTVLGRQGYDLLCTRYTTAEGKIKADLGDIVKIDSGRGTAGWFAVQAADGDKMTLRQLCNFHTATPEGWAPNGRPQIEPRTYPTSVWYCARVFVNPGLVAGRVSVGETAVSDCKNLLADGNQWNVNEALGMKVGDLFLHQEPSRGNVGASPFTRVNRVTGIDQPARRVTLAEPFGLQQDCYPLVFYVRVLNP
jgi:hypothetical protein